MGENLQGIKIGEKFFVLHFQIVFYIIQML